MKAAFAPLSVPETGSVAVAVLDGRALSPSARAIDEQLGGTLSRAIGASRFHGRKEQTLLVLAPGNSRLDRVLLVGLGKPAEIDVLSLQSAGGRIYAALAKEGMEAARVLVDPVEGCSLSPAEIAVELAEGLTLRSYRFAKYLTREKEDDKPSLRNVTFACAEPEHAQARFEVREKVIEGVFFTRDLVSEPGNVVYPETLATAAKSLTKLGVKVEVLGEAQMRKLGMNALLGVGQGSEREAQLVVMQWNGAGKPRKGEKPADDAGPLAFVGKGVTFDTGGISIKPSAGMEDMKYDMAGAGAVIGLMAALAGRKAKVNVVGVVGLVENMPSGKAQRPGDIVTSMSGQTIEVLNTDAEGRLVLADALWYTKERFHPRFLIDLATLTGAIVISLGHERAGLFSNDEALASRIIAAGDGVNEPVWRMPLGEGYDKLIKSDAADMKNIGNRYGGSITAAQFLKRFVADTPWAHLDIA
ncbi:MAG: leucyl aminopeptidase, partial [Rhodospirillales bacterium]